MLYKRRRERKREREKKKSQNYKKKYRYKIDKKYKKAITEGTALEATGNRLKPCG